MPDWAMVGKDRTQKIDKPEEFASLIRNGIGRWRQVIKTSDEQR
jgi:hypothetical protein